VRQIRSFFFCLLAAVALALTGCVTAPTGAYDQANGGRPNPGAILKSLSVDRAVEDRILALDPAHISDNDVRETLARGPAPRIVLLHGGVYPVHLLMISFGKFLSRMGYPEARLRDPLTGEWSYSPYETTERMTGLIAWHYEHDGMRPLIVGHSQGGLVAVKVLKQLAGQNEISVPVWNPFLGTDERTMITDPLSGRERPVIGLSVAYASAVGAGGLALVLPNQWDNLATLRKIPDTVDEFTGFFIGVDLIALSFPGNPLDTRYEATGKASVRNVTLPATYNHVTVPVTQDLPNDPQVREWLNAYVPDANADASALPFEAQQHVLWAADVWYSIKKHWCLEAQRLIRARRGAG
jgi:pimeloyl-ACP methyl ester carboxylesterase